MNDALAVHHRQGGGDLANQRQRRSNRKGPVLRKIGAEILAV